MTDDGEFTSLIRRHEGIIRSLARLYADTPEDREDVAQEICLQLWRSYPSFAGRAKVSTWIYRVGLNTAISLLRRRRRRPPVEDLGDVPAPPATDDEGRHALLDGALRRLGEGDRALLLLWLEELTYEEIGDVLGLSEGAVSVRLVRAREKLREIVRQSEVSHGRR